MYGGEVEVPRAGLLLLALISYPGPNCVSQNAASRRQRFVGRVGGVASLSGSMEDREEIESLSVMMQEITIEASVWGKKYFSRI